MNVAQCKMARAGLRWSLDDLAAASGISRRTVAKFEGGGKVSAESVETLRATLVKQGVEFANGGKRMGVSVPRWEG
jgi:transcriptional regulator with XRE-family HTH domain